MCSIGERNWWPLDLSDREMAAVRGTSVELNGYDRRHDRRASVNAVAALDSALQANLRDIVMLDTLPSYCHLLNGWGNATVGRSTLVDGLARYVHRTRDGLPHLLQCEDEGDFHPWQSFAYAVMAGVAPKTTIQDAECTLLELAMGSRGLNTDDGCELGHLLYTAAHLRLHESTEFGLRTRIANLAELAELAIVAHRHGHFKVCRKVHLTEGLCAISTLNPDLSRHRGVAQEFLSGQLDMLAVLATVVAGAEAARRDGKRLGGTSVVKALRESLIIESFIENHYYLAGHLIELAALAHGFGFEVTPVQWAAARFIVDRLNAWLPDYLPVVSLPGCFLHFGHYRRAVTLLAEVEDGASLDAAVRARFTASLGTTPGNPPPIPETYDDGVFIADRTDRRMSPSLAAIVAAYGALDEGGPPLSGNCGHFRRLLVPGWPRWLHFEFLDYDAVSSKEESSCGIGVELHAERPAHPALVAAFDQIDAELRKGGYRVESNLAWAHDWRRLRLSFPAATSPSAIARAMQVLFEVAVPVLSAEVECLFPGAVMHTARATTTSPIAHLA